MEITLIEYIEKGGIIMYILLFFNVTGFSIMLWKLIEIILEKRKVKDVQKEILISIKNSGISLKNGDFVLQFIKDEISFRIQKLEKGLNTVRIIATTSPLFGLLGTVIGVLNSFETISKTGMGEPSLFASGISLALITTIGGLIVSIPHYIGYNYLTGMIDNFEIELEKGLILDCYLSDSNL